MVCVSFLGNNSYFEWVKNNNFDTFVLTLKQN